MPESLSSPRTKTKNTIESSQGSQLGYDSNNDMGRRPRALSTNPYGAVAGTDCTGVWHVTWFHSLARMSWGCQHQTLHTSSPGTVW